MSLVSSRLSLTHRVTIQRDVADDVNDWNTPNAPEWDEDPLSDSVPCRYWANTGREAMDATTSAEVEDLRMIVPIGTDVSEQDRLGDITERGETLLAGPTGIRSVLRRKDHLELRLVRIS